MERDQFGLLTLLVMILAGSVLIPSGFGNLNSHGSGASGLPSGESGAGGAPVATVQKNKSKATSTINPAVALVCSFLGGVDDSDDSPESDQSTISCDAARDKFADHYEIETLIATLPDPVETRLGSQFDNYLDAIQQAANSAQYVMDRFNLVWSKDQGSEGSTKQTGTFTLEGMGSESASSANEKSASHSVKYSYVPGSASDPQITPAVFLFRHRERNKLLVLFVVGESPTRGIHRRAMLNALLDVGSLDDWWKSRSQKQNPTTSAVKSANRTHKHKKVAGNATRPPTAAPTPKPFPKPPPIARPIAKPECPKVKILGPSYSGSVLSLEMILGNWLDRCQLLNPTNVSIVNGSATNFRKDDQITKLIGQEAQKVTIGQDADLFSDLNHSFLRLEDTETPPIARVYERNTGYGDNGDAPNQNPTHILDLRFPLHIADLEKAANESERIDSREAPVVRRGSHLPLAGIESTKDSDLVPLFSAAETNTMDLQLAELLKNIAERRIRMSSSARPTSMTSR
jgi:hypothetical protein